MTHHDGNVLSTWAGPNQKNTSLLFNDRWWFLILNPEITKINERVLFLLTKLWIKKQSHVTRYIANGQRWTQLLLNAKIALTYFRVVQQIATNTENTSSIIVKQKIRMSKNGHVNWWASAVTADSMNLWPY